MSIKLGNYVFAGPYNTTNSLEDRSGIYAILCQREGNNYLIDVGESANVKTRVETHDRKDCWNRMNRERLGNLAVAVYYTTNLEQHGRMAIEQEIRNQYNVSCGER